MAGAQERRKTCHAGDLDRGRHCDTPGNPGADCFNISGVYQLSGMEAPCDHWLTGLVYKGQDHH